MTKWYSAKEAPNYEEWILTEWYDGDDGGLVIKDSVGGGHLLNFLGSILSVYKFKVVGNKYDKEDKV